MSQRFHVFPLAALSILLCSFAVGPAAAQDDDRSTVTVEGKGSVTAQPDRAVVRFGVTTRAETARQARSENATAAKSAMNAVRTLDVPEEKMRTAFMAFLAAVALSLRACWAVLARVVTPKRTTARSGWAVTLPSPLTVTVDRSSSCAAAGATAKPQSRTERAARGKTWNRWDMGR